MMLSYKLAYKWNLICADLLDYYHNMMPA